MEQNNFPVKLFSALAIVTSITVAACSNNDTNDAAVTTETTTSAMADTATRMPMTDTAAMVTPPAEAMPANADKMPAAGMAKPNPAKKGMKGKVSVAMPAAPKMKAEIKADASGVYSGVDYIPSFPGGTAGLQKFFNDNLQYPRDAAAEGVEGNVRVSFTVDENGKLMNPMIEGDKTGYGLDEEALRVIKKMPVWNPGKVNGKAVKTKFVLPVQFALSNE